MASLRQSWARLGVAFAERCSSRGAIDLERLIVETCVEGRRDPRLLFGMHGWLLKHHDLVNASRLIRMAKDSTATAVLGAICDSVLEHAPRSSLRYVRGHCKPLRQPEYVFEEVVRSRALQKINEEENLPVWKRWGLISREMGAMEGAIAEKGFVLSHNRNLAFRALFGTGVRAEILNYLVEQGEANARQISLSIGQSYEPVYSELKFGESVGLFVSVVRGRARVYHVTPAFLRRALKPLLAA